MRLEKINILDFKNISDANMYFAPKLNCFLGSNGMGKTNLLDAVYFLSFCRSFSGAQDGQLIRHGQPFAMLTASYRRRGEGTEINAVLQNEAPRKRFKRDGKEYRRLSAHIGMFPAVLIAPSDMNLVTGTGEERRRFLDLAISQSDPVYLDALMRYNHALQQRNTMLRQGLTDAVLFESVEQPMADAARVVTEKRAEFVGRLAQIQRSFYTRIAGEAAEDTAIEYQEAGGRNLADELERTRHRDQLLHHTTAGPHRDDILFTLNGLQLKRLASQGQQKTFTIALRLAQYTFLKQTVDLRPLLLLDDIFDKLDAKRVGAIIDIVRNDDFGQIFITDTNRQHLRDMFGTLDDADRRLWEVTDGKFVEINTLE